MRRSPLCLALLGACHSSPVATPDAGAPIAFASNCAATAPDPRSQLPAGPIDAQAAILPGGRAVTPIGTLLHIGGYPVSLAILPGDRYAVVTDDAAHDQSLRLVDLQATDPLDPNIATVPYPLTAQKGMFYGLAVTQSGQRIYLSNAGYDPLSSTAAGPNHFNTISVYDITGSPPQLVANQSLGLKLFFSQTGNAYLNRIPAGLRLSSDEQTLYVACQGDASLAILSLVEGPNYGAEIGTAKIDGIAPYDVAIDDASHTAFVSLWGGQASSQTGSQSGYVEGVAAIDITNPQTPLASPTLIETGKGAEAELSLGGRVYVANADADSLSIIDAASRQVRSVPVTTSVLAGASPDNLAVDPGIGGNPGRIYLTNANENSVAAIDLQTFQLIGFVPTAWYPTAVALRSDGALIIASARGLGDGPSDSSSDTTITSGTLQILPRPSDDELAANIAVVRANLERPKDIATQVQCPKDYALSDSRFPLPVAIGAPSPLKYVFLITREDKTYDSLFGDLSAGNGDPALMGWTDRMIPNARDLATRFVLLDNFYSHAEASIQGHEWTTSCLSNDYTEKSWATMSTQGRDYRSVNSLPDLGLPGSGSLWSHLDQSNVAYHNYGEAMNSAGARTQPDPDYPGVTLNSSISDVTKEQYLFDNIIKLGSALEPLSYIVFPDDQTAFTKDETTIAASMMADNDQAIGLFIDQLSHSDLWSQSLVVVVAAAPGNTYDHVEQHRSICLLASPWIKRNYHSSSMFDIASVYATIELILGIPPMNTYDGNAAPMYELFTTTPDFTPYDHISREIPAQ